MLLFRNVCPFILVLLFAGCGNGNVGITGKVTFSDTGEPLTKGSVVFQKDGKIYRGAIGENGTYTIVDLEKDGKGLPPGKYQVYVSGAQNAIEITPESGLYNYEQLIDRRHEAPDTSGLSVDVSVSTKTFDIVVDPFRGR